MRLTDSPFLRHCTRGPGMPAALQVKVTSLFSGTMSFPDDGQEAMISTSTATQHTHHGHT